MALHGRLFSILRLLLLALWQQAILALIPTSSSPKVGRVSAGPIDISSLGCGTWSWGNRLLFDYDPSQDEGIYEAYREIRNAGVTIFDTADSYGTFDLNGRAEILLGQFERRYQDELGGSDGKLGSGWTLVLQIQRTMYNKLRPSWHHIHGVLHRDKLLRPPRHLSYV